MTSDIKPVVLCILDGWGQRDPASDNAISVANTPIMDDLHARFSHALLKTSGLDVGLPDGQMGNSEVGHMNIGSGRIVMQDLPRIDQAIADTSLFDKPALQRAIKELASSGQRFHILGLLSDGGVHAHQNHILAVAKYVASKGIQVYVHAITDGRDTKPDSAKLYLEAFERDISDDPLISIATVSGRYYAMDRDKRWDRVELAYNAMVLGKGEHYGSALEAIEASYQKNVFDEFMIPAVINLDGVIRDGDVCFMANFRADRARQMTTAIADPDFKDFTRTLAPNLVSMISMVEYSVAHRAYTQPMFEQSSLEDILGQVVADAGRKQFRIAETEKYAHITFFFNGGVEEPFTGEDRKLIPSPGVPTYDMKPQMSAKQVTDSLVEAIDSGEYDFIVVNYANTDMVGHTGDLKAAIEAVQAVDHCVGRVFDAIERQNGAMIITADHGNAEQMVDPESGGPHTQHTTGPVPIILAGTSVANRKVVDGRLCDIAPTILALMGIDKPRAMTGEVLVG